MSNDDKIRRVMISSTAYDLPEHRKAVADACLRMDMVPVMMEYLTAMNADAIECDATMIDKADIYLGIFAYRYGYIPPGSDISATEMEYNRAVERDIPRLIFFMHADHPVKPSDVETGPGAEKLKTFKARVGTDRVGNFFQTVDYLRGLVIQALIPYRDKMPGTTSFHYVSDIPQPPEVYIAHPYTLLQTKDVIGRQAELNLLTDWVAKPSSNVFAARILNIVALGGMGKSAVTWKWFNDIAPQEMKPLAGRMWWSFYESDATFENFVIRALAYVSGRAREEIQKIAAFEREQALLVALSAQPFLIVLDGLERILIAYSGLDAARQLDDDEFDKRTANRVTGAIGLPHEAVESFVGQHRLRQCIDPRAGAFLRKLAGVRVSRILVSTRLYPTELQAVTGHPIPGSFPCFMTGLSDDDALGLWRAYGVSGSRDELLSLFHTFDNYPLLIRALAGEVAGYRHAPGDFNMWRAAHQDFDPFRLSLVNARTHVLEYALLNLTAFESEVLRMVAAFRMPTTYETLIALLVKTDGIGVPPVSSKPFATESQLDTVLASLEDRGLLGWDRRANRYDLHPIVRGVTWSSLADGEKTAVWKTLHGHFASIPAIDDDNITTFEDLTPAVELFNTLIGMGRYEDAFVIFQNRLDHATLYRLSASRRNAELLEAFFPDGVNASPRLESRYAQSWVLNSLALAYLGQGEHVRSIPLLDRAGEINQHDENYASLSMALANGAYAKSLAGALYSAVVAARLALGIARKSNNDNQENYSFMTLGSILASLDAVSEAHITLRHARDGFRKRVNRQLDGGVTADIAQRALWLGGFAQARIYANEAWRLAHERRAERDFIRAARLQGTAALELGDLAVADERLYHALTRARVINVVQEELPALTALAEMRRRQGNLAEARELLDGVWNLAERGPFPILHADARNVLARVERDAGNRDAAVAAATAAYKLAWCDGPPYAYHWGLEAAKALRELGAAPPECEPFDPAKYPPMPEVDIEGMYTAITQT